ncbi:MAG: allantoate amidohydrolase [Alphaproteobacteria bacterium]|nr:allantoate amidohydrolase [Alphaproteobacteria bacterium]
MAVSIPSSLGRVLEERFEALAAMTDKPGQLDRLYLSPAFRQACDQVAAWMQQAGMTAEIDAVGNVVGRYEGDGSDPPTMLLGSHIDTVRDAGNYDGTLGVLTAIACVQALSDAKKRLPFAIEVHVYGNEEGVRFPTILTGSRAIAGTLDPTTLDAKDADGVSIREALRAMGCDPDAWPEVAKARANLLGFLELHIEQGPVLEAEDLPLGIVTAINGARRYRVKVAGEAGHAGTVPMALRRDALAAAAEMALGVERIGRSDERLVATVGQIEVTPGASNVIPGEARFTIDLRAPQDEIRDRAAAELVDDLKAIAEQRSVDLDIDPFYEAGATSCSAALVSELEAAVERAGIRALKLPSGAGHDGQAVAALCPIAMLFLRCKDGISHNPAEAIDIDDAVIAVRIMLDFLLHLDPERLQP